MEKKPQSNGMMKENNAVKKKVVSEFIKSTVKAFVCYLETGGRK